MSLATVAGIGAAAAYLNAKYHIRKDVVDIFRLYKILHDVEKIKQTPGATSVWYMFEKSVAQFPNAECLWSREGSSTFRETAEESCRYAQFFLAEGVSYPENVAVCLTNRREYMYASLGAWAIGSAPAQINFNLSGNALVDCLKLAHAKIILVDDDKEVRGRVEEVRERIENEVGMKIVVLDAEGMRRISAFPATRPPDKLREQTKGLDTAQLIYTSGTTGSPKAYAFHNARMYGNAEGFKYATGQPNSPSTRWYVCMPMYHGTASVSGISIICTGQTLCIGKRFRVSTFWDDIRDSRATIAVYVGEALRYLLALPPSPRDKEHNLKCIYGNGLRPDVWVPFRERFGIESVIEFFNSTEGILAMAVHARGDFLATAVGHQGLLRRLLTWNRFVPVRTSEESNKDLARSSQPPHFCIRTPYNEGGEILVAAPSRDPNESGFVGYTDNEKATNERFAVNVFKEGDLWLRSGDALRRDDDGRWFFMDRLGDTFRWKSENVSTADVAAVLGDFPGLLEANVYGVLVPRHDGRAGCAAVHLDGGVERASKFDWSGLAAFAKKRLPRYAVPLFVRVRAGAFQQDMHNAKQNKVPLRAQGIEWSKIEGTGDRVFWWPPGADAYKEYTAADWEALQGGKARL